MLDAWGDAGLYPEELREEIEALNEWIYGDLQNGVYRAGFASSQEAYDEAFDGVFAALERLEALLGERRYLTGDRLTLADWRLFPTLVRFDVVYHTHFRCNGQAAHRPPEPVALYARALSAARRRRHRRHGPDPRALLHDARLAEPEAHHPARSAGPGFHGVSRAHRASRSASRSAISSRASRSSAARFSGVAASRSSLAWSSGVWKRM